MKEQRIIAFIGAQSSIILVSVSEGIIETICFFMISAFWIFRYIKLKKK